MIFKGVEVMKMYRSGGSVFIETNVPPDKVQVATFDFDLTKRALVLKGRHDVLAAFAEFLGNNLILCRLEAAGE